jgi:aminoglycoside phosphotransferase (APT) family kinase protein
VPIAVGGLRVGVQHGDLSHPNLIALRGGGIGVVDWELSELHGLPLQDASYFLAYAAFARARARGVAEELAAFDEAFISPGGWAARELGAYARRTGIPGRLVTPLFVAGWARSAARMRNRLEPGCEDSASAWLRGSRYYVLWRHALGHASELQWEA